MSRFKKILFFIFFSSVLLFFSILTFLWWNHFPPLPEHFSTEIICLNLPKKSPLQQYLKIASYNIHFGIGLKWSRKDRLQKQDFKNRLNKIAEILREINADVVFLQEVDFDSSRSKNIDQSKYLAKRSGYSYIAKAPYFKEKFHPNLQGMHGRINVGLCILSRFPLKNHEVHIFPYPDEMPFYLKWLYNPHGVQKAVVQLKEKKITLMNVHLEPWSQKTREKESLTIVEWINNIKGPLILGGDFNAISPEMPNKKGHYLTDAPWFIDRSKWNIEKDKTIQIIRSIQDLSEAVPPKKFLQDCKTFFTYPSNDPKEMIDYLFARKKAKALYGHVFHKAKTASDHLPITVYIQYLPSEKKKKSLSR